MDRKPETGRQTDKKRQSKEKTEILLQNNVRNVRFICWANFKLDPTL